MSSFLNVADTGNTTTAGGQTPTRRSLSPTAASLLADRAGPLPIWVRAPVTGPERWSGITRAKLYDLYSRGCIRSVSLREPGKVKGVRLFNLASILEYIENAERAAQATVEDPKESD